MYSSHSIVRVTCLRLSSRDASQPNRARHAPMALLGAGRSKQRCTPYDPANYNYWPSAKPDQNPGRSDFASWLAENGALPRSRTGATNG